MRITNILLAIAIFSLTTPIFANSGEPINLALIADQTSGQEKSPLVSLLEVELSQREDIKLLERAAIDSILEEQQLSAAGLLDRNNAIKFGKLLRADAFVILSNESPVTEPNMVNISEESGGLIRVRVSETAHGLRLLDYFVQSDSNSVGNIVQKLESVINKINQPDEKLIPVGIVDIHRVQLAEQYKILERTLPVLLSVRLNLEPQIIMLEREDLKTLLDEKLMTEGEDTDFWSSAILIDGYIQPNNGQLEMHLNLKQAAGENLKSIIVPVEPNEPSNAIVRATTEIIQQLQNSPPAAKWQPEQEAEQFYKQGMMLSTHNRNDEAISLFETAHALQPGNVFYTGAVFENIWISHNQHVRTTFKTVDGKRIPVTSYINDRRPDYNDYALMELVSILVRQIRDNYNKGQISSRDIHDIFSNQLGTELMGNGGYFVSFISIATEQIRQFNLVNRRIWIDIYSDALEKQPIRNDYPQMNNLIQARLAWLSSDIPEELIANLRKAFTEFIMPPELGGKIKSADERDRLFEQAFLVELRMLSPINLERTHLRNISEEFLKLWQEYMNELANSDDASVSSKGQLALARKITVSPNDSERKQAENLALKAVKDMEKKLTNPDEILDGRTKRQLITNIKNSLTQRSSICSTEERFLIWENIYKFFISQKDIDSLVELGISPLAIEPRNTSDLSKSNYSLLEVMTEILQTRKGDIQVNETLVKINDAQAEIRNRFPELKLSHAVSNLSVLMLFNQQDLLKQFDFSDNIIQIQGDTLWIAMAGGNFSRTDDKGNMYYLTDIGMVGINLNQKRTISLWQTTIYQPNRFNKLSGLIVTDNASYISLQNVGILELPGSQISGIGFFIDPNAIPKEELRIKELKKTFQRTKLREDDKQEIYRYERKLKLYTQENSLPSVLITSMVQDQDKLWVAYGDQGEESGLGLYDPKTEEWESVFCSTLKDESPFSQGQPYMINSMILRSRKRLIFNVFENNFKENGLWKLNTDTFKTECIWSGYGTIFKDINDTIWLNSTNYKMKFNPDSEKITMIIGPGRHQLYANTIKAISGLDKDIFLPESFVNKIKFGPYYVQGNLDLSTGAIKNNKLWARLGKNLIIIAEKGKSFEDAQIIDNNILDGKPVERFVSTPYGLVGIGEGTVGLIENENIEK